MDRRWDKGRYEFVAGGWFDITDGAGTRRASLRDGVTHIGGVGADVVLSARTEGELEVRDDPVHVRFVGERGSAHAPTVNGRRCETSPLHPGDRVEWSGCTLVYGEGGARRVQAPLEEVHLETPAAETDSVRAGKDRSDEERVLRRLTAGLALELGLADRAVARRWRDAVVKGEFDADACASEVLLTGSVDTGDARLVERSGRLLRDFLMAPLLRGAHGAGRRARRAVRGGVAFLVSQLVALSVLALILLAAMLLLRVQGVSFDELLDRLLLR